MHDKSIKQKIMFKCFPSEIYESLIDSEKHSAFTGDKAIISAKEGGKFTAYGDYIEGTNIKLIKNKKIVQKWRTSDWPKDHYSIITFEIKEKDGETELIFTQKGIPENSDVSEKAWTRYYWNPLRDFLKRK